eukprot:UN00458
MKQFFLVDFILTFHLHLSFGVEDVINSLQVRCYFVEPLPSEKISTLQFQIQDEWESSQIHLFLKSSSVI